MAKEFIENLPDTFPGGGYYIDKELGVMPCQPELGRPTDAQAKAMQKIDILAQTLESMVSGAYGTEEELVTDLKDAIFELNGQTILLLKLFCMESEVINRGNYDDQEGRQEERRNDGADQG